MPSPLSTEAVPLALRARAMLRLNQRELGVLLGISRRTVIRWSAGSVPSTGDLITLAKAVYPKDVALAAELAKAAGARLPELGLGVPVTPPPSPIARELAIDSIVCAAAEASMTTPQAIRAGLLAALERAAKLGVGEGELRSALRK